MSVRAFIGLGANLGDAQRALTEAVEALRALQGVSELVESRRYRSAPIDSTGPDYINAVVSVSTTLTPQALLAGMQGIESAHGRQRPYRNAPRTLDLDLLLYGDQMLATEALTVPHPRLHQRAFVLHPLAELAPDLMLPAHGSVTALLPSVADQKLEVIA